MQMQFPTHLEAQYTRLMNEINEFYNTDVMTAQDVVSIAEGMVLVK